MKHPPCSDFVQSNGAVTTKFEVQYLIGLTAFCSYSLYAIRTCQLPARAEAGNCRNQVGSRRTPSGTGVAFVPPIVRAYVWYRQVGFSPAIGRSLLARLSVLIRRTTNKHRVARRPCGRPALSELGVKVSLHPAQALRTPL
jgi:hypothetical protein